MENVAEKLFNILKTKFNNTDIKTLTQLGKETTDMEEIKMFSFQFLVDSKDYGPVVILLNADENLEVYYGDNTSKSLEGEAKKKWENLIEHLSTFARTNRYGFSLKHTTDLKYDLSDTSNITESFRNIFEGYYGTSKTSYNPQGKAKIIIKHSKRIGEEDARFRNISSLFIENADGERFKLPFKKLAGARAMARHVTEGGNPYDLFGLHISEMVKDINTLGGFVRRSKMFENDDETAGLVETGRTHYNSMRKGLKQIAGKRGYFTFKENWEPSEITEQDEATDTIRKLFTEKSINERVAEALPLLARLQSMAEAQDNELVEADVETYKGFDIKIKPFKKKFVGQARNRAGRHAVDPVSGKTKEDALAAIHAAIDNLVQTQKTISGDANVNFNSTFVTHLLKTGDDEEIWAKLIPGPKLVLAGQDILDLGPAYLKSEGFIKSGSRNPGRGEHSVNLPGIGISAKHAKASGATANGRYLVTDETTDVDGNRIFDLEFDSVVAHKDEKVLMGAPAITVATRRQNEAMGETATQVELKSARADTIDESFEIDTLSGEDGARIRDFLNQEGIKYSGMGPVIRINLNRSSLDAATIVSHLHRIAQFDERAEMKEITEFEKWADNVVEADDDEAGKKWLPDTDFEGDFGIPQAGKKVNEGSWALPETAKQIRELKAFMSKKQPVGIDAMNATSALYNIIGDDDLFDSLGELADKEPEGDARILVRIWLRRNMPKIADKIKKRRAPTEGLENELDADNDHQLNASVNKSVDAYVRKDKTTNEEVTEMEKLFTEYVAEIEEGKKPDFLDVDKDGDKEETMDKALKDKEKDEVKEEDTIELEEAHDGPIVSMDSGDDLGALMQRTNHLLNK